MGSYSVFIVEDNPTTMDVLVQVVKAQPGLSLGGTAENLHTALQGLKQVPDIILVDIGLPDGSGIDLIHQAREQHPDTEIMVISSYSDEAHVVEAIRAGATSYMLKDSSLASIGNHILSLMKGESPISPGIARYLLKRFNHNAGEKTEHTSPELTERESDVLTLIAKGYSREKTAATLHISIHTAKTHIKNIYRKLSVHSSTQAAFKAYQQGLIKPPE